MDSKEVVRNDYMRSREEFNRGIERILEKETGHSVRPHNDEFREDGFVNMVNKYGTEKDISEQYKFSAESMIPDTSIEEFYENNGLFSRIIDLPAEEAIKHGFDYKNIKNEDLKAFFDTCLEELEWDESAMDAIKWARLFGGAIGVMLIDDGHGLEEPLDWKNIKSIDNIKIYDRSVVVPDYASMYTYENEDPFRTRGSRLGYPETFYVSSLSGNFTVHESRCLIFQNGKLPEKSQMSLYKMWGIPEYIKCYRAVRDVEVAHGMAVKLLDRSVQAIYSMKNLAMELASEGGEERVLKRLETIDMTRGLMNSMVIDAEGENYDFKSFSYSGVSDVINTTCNYLSSVTNIPQTLLFGRSPAGMNATGTSDLENYYNYVERIQKKMVKTNLRYLLTVIAVAAKHNHEIEKIPDLRIEFKPLWSLNETEQVALDMQKAQVQSTKAQTAATYMSAQVLDPSEVRKSLAKEDDFDIETMLDDFTEEEIENMPQGGQQGGGDMLSALMGGMGGQGGGMSQPNAQGNGQGKGQVPMQDKQTAKQEGQIKTQKPSAKHPMRVEVKPKITEPATEDKSSKQNLKAKTVKEDAGAEPSHYGVGVLVINNKGEVLTGTRMRGAETGTLCGPGGHIENGETPEQAGKREAYEEFGIVPLDMIKINETADDNTPDHMKNVQYLCTRFKGEPLCDGEEMSGCKWRDIDELYAMEDRLFSPFRESLNLVKEKASKGIFPSSNTWEK